ncbi:MAG: glycosyltransferase [Phycisphaeraceae bacterium]|nr:glycosyltransferase [Phycisphaeraceae bacterium]
MATDHRDILILSDRQLWPLDQGARLRGYHMATTLQSQGWRVGISSWRQAEVDEPDELAQLMTPWPQGAENEQHHALQAWSGLGGGVRKKLGDFLGPDLPTIAGALALVRQYQPKVVIGLGPHAPVLLSAIPSSFGVRRIWYAADELVNFHVSCLRRESPRLWPQRLVKLGQHAAMERLFLPLLDGAIGVSPRDALLLRQVAGARRAVCIRNGVDLGHFKPCPQEPDDCSLVFWGRMDFEPNIDAMLWFTQHVWPGVRGRRPGSKLRIIGKKPTPPILALAQQPGIEVLGEVEDLRPYAWSASAVIAPMRCGGGIKNKLLEAAAMARPILASPLAVRGLELPAGPPTMLICRKETQWLENIARLFSSPSLQRDLGQRARAWVAHMHNWDHAAANLMAWIKEMDSSSAERILFKKAPGLSALAEADGKEAA